MVWTLSPEAVLEKTADDAELIYRLNGFDGVLRVTIAANAVDLVVTEGAIILSRAAEGEARLHLVLPEGLLDNAALAAPPPMLQGVLVAQHAGARIEGDMIHDIAPYLGALNRLFNILRIAWGGADEVPLPAGDEPFRDTDTAIGRYLWVTVDGTAYRIYYEEAGAGAQPLLLQHTAGADSRQWRHQLADPEFQSRFRVIAYDLPFHGRSLPPSSQDWWRRPYAPSKEWMMKVVVAIADGLGLDRPLFMGCSVGGQLALDLAAHHSARFGGFIALNGTLDYPGGPDDSWNSLCRDTRVSGELYSFGNLGATSPYGPEAFRREIYWIYRSNAHGTYSGDNGYFMSHDLKVDGHLIDGARTPVYLLAGEYDPVSVESEHGGPAVAARFPSVVYRVLPRLSHFAPTDDPIAFRASLLPVLDEIMAKSDAMLAAAE